MAIEIEKLSDLSADDVRQEAATLAELIQEAAPTIDVRRGVLHDLLLQYSAILAAKNQTEMDRLRRSMSIAAIHDDPTLADDTVVDNVASNYGIIRQTGGLATGSVTIILDLLADATVAAGSIFVANGKSFVTETAFTGRSVSAAVVLDTDREIISRGDGTYSFEIAVTAQEAGEASQLVKGTALVPNTPVRNFVLAVASEDFIDGISEEGNLALVNRLPLGQAAKTMSARLSMSASLRDNFPSVLHDSLIGMGDAEMLRDRHTVFPVSFGGRADWYVQTQGLYRTYGKVLSATLVEKTNDGLGIWQLAFDRDDYPGLYNVSVSLQDQIDVLFPIVSITRSTDISGLDSNDGFVPEIVNVRESAFSRFQTVTVKFKDTITSVSGLSANSSVKDYEVSIRAMPLISEIQGYASQRLARSIAGDVLVKAPVPCFVNFSAKILLLPGQDSPSAALIASDLAELTNHWGFRGKLPASAFLDVIHNSLESGALVESVRMEGRIEYPDGTFKNISSNEVLEIPYEPEKFVTSRTTLFFLDPANVQLDISTAEVLPVI
jgi:hypothetical protein